MTSREREGTADGTAAAGRPDAGPAREPADADGAFGPSALRLSPREWLVAGALIAAVLGLLPVLAQRVEPLAASPDVRLPYRLGSDYWTYARLCRAAASANRTLAVGDSVVWGHYVAARETLTGHLNALAGGDRFANLGVDGIHPAALAGLVEFYGRAMAGRRVLLHANLLWMSSDRHDLATEKEFAFNHPRLVPQFLPRIPCYRQDVAGRLAIVMGRMLPFAAWAGHLRTAYWEDLDLAAWTVRHPYACPASALGADPPSPDDPPSPAPDARPWTAKDIPPFDPPWVDLATSLQWASLRRTVALLRERGSRVFVLVGPFNEHMLAEGSRRTYKERKRALEAWLTAEGIPHAAPDPLPSEHYADASHPLGEGYRLLARQLLEHEAFSRFAGVPAESRRDAQ